MEIPCDFEWVNHNQFSASASSMEGVSVGLRKTGIVECRHDRQGENLWPQLQTDTLIMMPENSLLGLNVPNQL